MAKFIFVALVIFVHKAAAIYECCPGINNFIENKLCSDNSTINLKCDVKQHKIVMPKNEISSDYYISDNGTLFDRSNSDDPTRVEYCYTHRGRSSEENETTFLIFCYNAEQELYSAKTLSQAIMLCISVAFVIFTMLVYFLLPNLLDLQGKCTMHFLAGLAGSYIILAEMHFNASKYDDSSYVLCKTLAYLMYFSFVYMFLWLTILSFHIWRTTVKPSFAMKTVSWLIVYHVVGIGGALTALLIILAAHYSPSDIWEDIRPGFGEVSCWFVSRRQTWIYFYGPLTVLLALNIVFYLWTLVCTCTQEDNSRNKNLKYRLKLCLRLCIIMGITWCFEVITFALNSGEGTTTAQITTYMLDLLNALQGILIFLVLVVFRKSVRRSLATKNLCNIRFPNSWKYLEDEEMESAEEKANGFIIGYSKNEEQHEAATTT